MSRLSFLFKYYFERFRPYPWFVIPFVISYLLVGFRQESFTLALYLIISFLFYRLFDDIMMSDWDKGQSREGRQYLKHLFFLKKLVYFPFFLYLVITFSYFNFFSFLLSLAFTAMCFFFYRVLNGNKSSLLISTWKYLFLSIIAVQDAFHPWPYIIFLLFFFSELVNEKFIKVSKHVPVILFIIAIAVKSY